MAVLSHYSSRMNFFANEKVEMTPMRKNEWMARGFQMEEGNAGKMASIHKSADVPWLLVTDTLLSHSQIVCFGFAELEEKPSHLLPNQ